MANAPRALPLPASRYVFPPASRGTGREGIVSIGADFEPGTLLEAYRHGIFPWPSPSEDVTLWCSPNPRAVFPLETPPHWSRSLRRSLRKKPFRVTVDQAFEDVVLACGARDEGTWITPELVAGYVTLHQMGWAHSLEVWNTESGALVGGIYGLALGSAFTAESMFHRETDASKVAFVSLVERLRPDFDIFDAQIMNPHLASLGCVDMRRVEFLKRLSEAIRRQPAFPTS